MTAEDLVKLVPTMQSIALLSKNIGYLKKKKRKLVSQGIDNLISLPLIKATAEMTDF